MCRNISSPLSFFLLSSTHTTHAHSTGTTRNHTHARSHTPRTHLFSLSHTTTHPPRSRCTAAGGYPHAPSTACVLPQPKPFSTRLRYGPYARLSPSNRRRGRREGGSTMWARRRHEDHAEVARGGGRRPWP